MQGGGGGSRRGKTFGDVDFILVPIFVVQFLAEQLHALGEKLSTVIFLDQRHEGRGVGGGAEVVMTTLSCFSDASLYVCLSAGATILLFFLIYSAAIVVIHDPL